MGSAVKWGIVSTADINRKVIPGAHASDKIDLVGVASRDQGRADAYAHEWDIPRAYGSYEALLADPEIEAVYISLPNTLHAEWSIKALEAGKHVLCEKPFTRHPEEVDAAFDAAERSGRLLSEAFMYRHNPQTAKLVELVRDGAIGELRLIRSAFSYGLYDAREHPPSHRRRRRRPDGRRLLQRLGLAAARRRAGAGLGRGVVRAFGNGLGLQRNAALSRETCSPPSTARTALAERDELEAIGSEGSLFLDDPWHCVASGHRAAQGRRASSGSSSSPSTRTGWSSRT